MARRKKKPMGGQPPKQEEPPVSLPVFEPAAITEAGLSGKHRATLEAIFATPIRTNIPWNDFVALMTALGAQATARGSSAHSFLLRNRVGVFHRPHPGNEIYRELLQRIRLFLTRAGVRP